MINLEESFLFNAIRKYNRVPRQTQKDVVLHSVGVKFGLVEPRRAPLPELSQEERDRVLDRLRDFCKEQGVEVLLKPASNSPATYQ